MAEALLFVSVGSLLTVGAAILVVAALVLRNARRSVELAEYYLECLREEQARLLAFLSEEREIPKEEPKQEREQYLVEARQRAERLSRERLSPRQEQVRLAEELEQERAQHLEAQQQARHEREGRERERRARRDAERRMGQLKQELQKLRAAQQESFLPVPARSSKNLPETHELAGEKPSPTQGAQEAERTPPASFLETTTPESAKVSSEDKRPRLAVWHPHPDDGAGREKASEGQTRTGSDAPVKVFRKHYDKYLENYQGYVELAERLYQMRDNGEMPPGLEEREWENRLHRVNDGIERTTARLDILEEHNPELATDDRVSHRASLARRHSLLGA